MLAPLSPLPTQISSPHRVVNLQESSQVSRNNRFHLPCQFFCPANIEEITRDFPGSSGIENPPANSEDTGSVPGPGRSHMPQGNRPCAEPACPRAPYSAIREALSPQVESSHHSLQLRKAHIQQRPNLAKI